MTPVISSQAPLHRLHHPAPRGPLHGLLVAVARTRDYTQNAPEKGMARRAVFMITASPLGEEEASHQGRGAKGVAVPPWKRREAGGVGGNNSLSSAGYRLHQHEVERCESISLSCYLDHSDEHDAEHGVRSGKEQLPVRTEMTKPGASSFIVILDRTGPVCERSETEEHRTK